MIKPKWLFYSLSFAILILLVYSFVYKPKPDRSAIEKAQQETKRVLDIVSAREKDNTAYKDSITILSSQLLELQQKNKTIENEKAISLRKIQKLRDRGLIDRQRDSIISAILYNYD